NVHSAMVVRSDKLVCSCGLSIRNASRPRVLRLVSYTASGCRLNGSTPLHSCVGVPAVDFLSLEVLLCVRRAVPCGNLLHRSPHVHATNRVEKPLWFRYV